MPLSIEELDNQVRTFYEGRGETQAQAQTVLNQFKEDPDAWLTVDEILQKATYEQTKYLGLQVLDNVIMTRWKVLPREQCHGIRNFVVQYILQCSSSEELLKAHRVLLNKLNLVLVSVLKQEWPHNWPTFINEIISASRSSLSICENNMIILRLLSEEVFDYSAEQMTSMKTRNLKTTMCAEFSQIFQLCQEVLNSANQPSLIKATLETLLRFCNWIPLGYIFETPLIETLRTRFLEVPEFRNITLQCLTEIGGLQIGGPTGQQPNYGEALIKMFTEVLTTISNIIPLSMDLKATYPASNSRDQEFIQNLALFLCNFFGMHLPLIENLPNRDFLTHGHYYLIRISQIEDREIFKICLDYWLKLVQELYEEMQALPLSDMNPLLSGGLQTSGAPNPALLNNYPLRKHKYNEILSNLRVVMIEKMVRPEEVLIVENDEGEIVREFVKETDTVQLYKTIRECLVYLTHLDVVDTEQIMTDKLARQVDGSEWSWHNCNVLCWAIGSISLAMNEETEKRFLVTVIKDLLGLTEMKRGKDNKAVVASNIMYIVGQYPRFLKAHWKFLKTVVNKLFEFMHESHEGVQDMACDTFIKIAKSCRRHFVALQPSESQPFIEEIIRDLGKITCDLTPQQVHTFYEACGYMVAAQGNRHQQERLLSELMQIPNMAWQEIIRQASLNPNILQDADTIKVIGNIMKTNVSACSSIGTYFFPQIGNLYSDMLQMYAATSQLISEAVAREGEIATKMPKVRGLRTIKKEILKLIETYVDKAEDLQAVREQMVPPLLDSVLVDYNRNVPGARDAEVLRAMTAMITKLSALMEDQVPIIMENVFECTLDMINKNFSEYPEHRVEFFNLLRAINLHCFPALLKLDNRQFKFVIDSCMWASKHDNRDVETAGLNMCLELVNNIAEKTDVQTSNAFFNQFFVSILQDVFFVLTDQDHKAGFKTQSMLLMRMFYFVHPADGSPPRIQGPIYQPDQAQPGTGNKEFLTMFVGNLLQNAFANLTPAQITSFVDGLFTLNTQYDKFRLALRDFLISLREFAGDNAELYLLEKEQQETAAKAADIERRSKVSGLLKPSELEDDEL
ncbi:CRM1 C terminal-domain-containing protein [Copromyces sp. CBS 386.78]|uniref:CRM1 C terminal-domain-containing protein n=1 Tax=Pseudoneurospora amorphoporcata TaxID=241081 RepID=A0AAN6NPT1_9PEZI|nr:CRM1 C terminal-domain-containing protein [Copromyces sp. CBS 386.78]KAK3948851.1 CRM1 C terminal-domain-containing protein [Pseudoneurospora amorphoporcata]